MVVSFANFFNFGFFRASEVTEVVEEGFRPTRSERFADERTEVLAVTDGGGKEELFQLVTGVAAFGGSWRYFAA